MACIHACSRLYVIIIVANITKGQPHNKNVALIAGLMAATVLIAALGFVLTVVVCICCMHKTAHSTESLKP